jgi:3'(2'), 5'-bisphosphate nucleotidase
VNLSALLPIAIKAAELACAEILSVYNSNDFQTELKGDNSPLTRADKLAHEKISEILSSTGLPILSEEGKAIPYEVRKEWKYFWMVDPLDGTKEFLKRNGEFTVNIALIHEGAPVLGVVAIPVTGEVFYASRGAQAFCKLGDETRPLPTRKRPDLSASGLRVVASRSHMNPETEAFINGLKDPVLVSAGSSLKFLLVAKGEADVYPRFAPTMEWDTAAADAIVREIGFKVTQSQSDKLLEYNKPELLNPSFLVS